MWRRAPVALVAVLVAALSTFVLAPLAVPAARSSAATVDRTERAALKKLTPILYVEAIEPVLPFWTDRLGFEVTAEVPEGDRLGFVILKRDAVEVMFQTRASVQADIPAMADLPMGGSILFIEVESLDPIVEVLEGAEVLVPRRTTFYGADEIFVREPGGNTVGFAAFSQDAAEPADGGD
jgi:catechol 2,3-dioxygenase-like lactoylglutathione lyase family enzyme